MIPSLFVNATAATTNDGTDADSYPLILPSSDSSVRPFHPSILLGKRPSIPFHPSIPLLAFIHSLPSFHSLHPTINFIHPSILLSKHPKCHPSTPSLLLSKPSVHLDIHIPIQAPSPSNHPSLQTTTLSIFPTRHQFHPYISNIFPSNDQFHPSMHFILLSCNPLA